MNVVSQIDSLSKICLHSTLKICTNCSAKPKKVAMRAGTAGYRAPEILLKYQQQSTAVDVWSAGVIFMSILSGCYPFFKSSTDMGHLVQITTLLGSQALRNAARALDTRFTSNPEFVPYNLEKLCIELRKHKCPNSPCELCIPKTAYQLLERCLDPNPRTRITADEALQLPYFQDVAK